MGRMRLSVAEISEGIPSLKPLILLIIGILVSDYEPVREYAGLLLSFILIFTGGIFLTIEKKYFKHFYMSEIMVSLMLLSLFFWIALNHKREIREYPENTWLAKLEAYPGEKEKTSLLELRLLFSADDSILFLQRTLLYAYVEKSFDVSRLDPGQLLILHCGLQRISNTGNPGEFDYASYLERKNVYYRVFIKPENLIITSSYLHDLRTRSAAIAGFLGKRIENAWGSEKEKSVFRAIGLGDRSTLEKDQRLEYSRAGAIHIMAVSGLHVGLLWMFLGFAFRLFGKGKMSRFFSLILGIIILWCYALITGLSPSVCRACLMFTLVNVGKLLSRRSKLVNTVVLSAFILLLINPDLLYELGFQFSYAAVLGIIVFQPRFTSKLTGVKAVLKYPAELAIVSLSAQVFTAPLTLFYFHSFPLYFLFTNLVIIPMVTLLMTSFLLSCILLPVEVLSYFFISLGLRFTWLMNKIVELINTLPSPVIEGISVPGSLLLISLLIPLALLLWLYYRQFLNLIFLLILMMASASLILVEKLRLPPAYLGVYLLQEGPVLGLCYEGKHWILHFYEEDKVKDGLAYAASSYWIGQKSPEPVYMNSIDSLERADPDRIVGFADENGFIFLVVDKRIAVIRDETWVYREYEREKMEVDVLVVLEKLRQKDIKNLPFKFHHLVCPKLYSDSEIQTFENENFEHEVWDLSAKGAFISKIPVAKTKKRQNH